MNQQYGKYIIFFTLLFSLSGFVIANQEDFSEGDQIRDAFWQAWRLEQLALQQRQNYIQTLVIETPLTLDEIIQEYNDLAEKYKQGYFPMK